MSGQAITIPTGTVGSLRLGELEQKDVSIGIWDMEQLMPGSDIAGFLSLGFFRENAVTVDYENQRLVLETAESLGEIAKRGTSVPIKLDAQGESLGTFMPVDLPNGQRISVEVDTGSEALILHEKFMKILRVSKDGPTVKTKEGKDETGHSYFRYFTKLEGDVHLPGDKKMGVSGISVMYQKIIYEGLVGHAFLREFSVTYDIPNARMNFRKP